MPMPMIEKFQGFWEDVIKYLNFKFDPVDGPQIKTDPTSYAETSLELKCLTLNEDGSITSSIKVCWNEMDDNENTTRVSETIDVVASNFEELQHNLRDIGDTYDENHPLHNLFHEWIPISDALHRRIKKERENAEKEDKKCIIQ